jgi:predicted nucleic acid-binding Zn ribbon protein
MKGSNKAAKAHLGFTMKGSGVYNEGFTQARESNQTSKRLGSADQE